MRDTTDVAGRRLTELLSAADPRSTVEEVLRTLADRLFFVVITLGALSTGANLIRSYFHGWHPSYFFDIGTFLSVVILLALRNRLPIAGVFWAIVAAAAVGGVTSLAALGLASAGMLILTAVSILAGILFGLRAGLVVIGLALAVIATLGFMVHWGLAGNVPGIERFVRAPSTWFTQGLAFAVYTVSAVFAAHAIQQRFARSRSELAERTEELRNAYHHLRASEERYRLIAENTRDMVFMQDVELRPVYVSPSIERLFGYTVEEGLGLSIDEWMTPESLDRARSMYAHYLGLARDGSVAVPLLEFEYVRKDGSTFWGELRVSFLHDENGEITGSQGVLRDITERIEAEERRRQLEEELRQSEKMQVIGQLAGGVAHDFNNQLAAIMGFADLIRRNEGAGQRTGEHAEMILRAAKRSSDLTGKLLAFARKGKYQNVVVDLHAVIGDTVEVLERSIGRRVAIRRHLEANPHTTVGDPSQLESAFLNLGLNARDAMPEGGEMLWRTAVVDLDQEFCGTSRYRPAPGRFIEVTVSDTGEGMTPEVRERIFEPFFTTKEVGSGTGMGLAAVDGTVRNHLGALTVESTRGVGTTFRLFLPLAECGADEGEWAEAPATEAAVTEGRIMVVDDEPLVCRMAGLLVERLGYRVDRFTDPRDALGFYRDHHNRIALVIMDAIMPGMSGKELYAGLREVDPNVRVLLSSGHDTHEDVAKVLALGVHGFILKPYKMHELAAKIHEVLARGA